MPQSIPVCPLDPTGDQLQAQSALDFNRQALMDLNYVETVRVKHGFLLLRILDLYHKCLCLK